MAVLRFIRRKPFGKELLDVGDHFPHVFKLRQIVGDRRIKPSERPQLRIVIGVGKVADVKDEVGGHRNAVFERKAFKG